MRLSPGTLYPLPALVQSGQMPVPLFGPVGIEQGRGWWISHSCPPKCRWHSGQGSQK